MSDRMKDLVILALVGMLVLSSYAPKTKIAFYDCLGAADLKPEVQP